jgi:hypothetical protein
MFRVFALSDRAAKYSYTIEEPRMRRGDLPVEKRINTGKPLPPSVK